jgi:hypothetical protein
MIKTLTLAAATAALVLGSIAVAQTAPTAMDTGGANAPANTNANAPANGTAVNNANQNGTDAAAANTNAPAGERG